MSKILRPFVMVFREGFKKQLKICKNWILSELVDPPKAPIENKVWRKHCLDENGDMSEVLTSVLCEVLMKEKEKLL